MENPNGKTVWWAECEGITLMGTFDSQRAAMSALRLTPEEQKKQRRIHAKGWGVWPRFEGEEP